MSEHISSKTVKGYQNSKFMGCYEGLIPRWWRTLRPQFIDFCFFIRCFTCTQCGQAGGYYYIKTFKDVGLACQKVCKEGRGDIIVKVNIQSPDL